jgi:hypothetical protein
MAETIVLIDWNGEICQDHGGTAGAQGQRDGGSG